MLREQENERTRHAFARCCIVALAFVSGCNESIEPSPAGASRDGPHPNAAAPPTDSAVVPPAVLFLPEDYEELASAAMPARSSRCPPEMVLVRDRFCIDRFEVTLVEKTTARELSPHYPPTRRYTRTLFERFVERPARPQGPLQTLLPFPQPPDFQLTTDFEPRAVSKPGALPAGYLNKYSAQAACENAAKRLCSRNEWVTACRGERNQSFPYGATYEEGACNVHRKSHPARLLHGDASQNHLDPRLGLTQDNDGPLLRRTGATPRCKSTWNGDAAFDMVGNLDEWIDEAAGSFVGGFYSRGTTAGCAATIDLHSPDYLDYSLGTRCCREARSPDEPHSAP